MAHLRDCGAFHEALLTARAISIMMVKNGFAPTESDILATANDGFESWRLEIAGASAELWSERIGETIRGVG